MFEHVTTLALALLALVSVAAADPTGGTTMSYLSECTGATGAIAIISATVSSAL